MLEYLTQQLCLALTQQGIPARRAYPDGPADAGEAVYLTLTRAETPEGGAPRYLGERSAPGEEPREVYGLRCRVTLALEVCVPAETAEPAQAALALLHRTVEVLADGQLRLERLHREEPMPDRAGGTLRLKAMAEGGVLLLFDRPEEAEAAFRDFVLRGELKHEDN